MSPNADVVIVHYFGRDQTAATLARFTLGSPYVRSVSIVDNNSPHPLSERERGLARMLRTAENLGFAAAANLGAREGSAPYILFLNPDVNAGASILGALIAVSETSNLSAAAPLLLLPDGRPQVGMAGRRPGWLSLAGEHVPLLHRLAPQTFAPFFGEGCGFQNAADVEEGVCPVDWLCGACLLVRRDAFEEIGGFDEAFFLYGEDIDLGCRMTQNGHRIGLAARVATEHRQIWDDVGDTAAPGRAVPTAWLDGLDRYYREYRPGSRRGFHALSALGFAGRALAYRIGLVSPKSPEAGAAERVGAYARHSIALALRP